MEYEEKILQLLHDAQKIISFPDVSVEYLNIMIKYAKNPMEMENPKEIYHILKKANDEQLSLLSQQADEEIEVDEDENLWYDIGGPDNYSDRYLSDGVYVRKDGTIYSE